MPGISDNHHYAASAEKQRAEKKHLIEPHQHASPKPKGRDSSRRDPIDAIPPGITLSRPDCCTGRGQSLQHPPLPALAQCKRFGVALDFFKFLTRGPAQILRAAREIEHREFTAAVTNRNVAAVGPSIPGRIGRAFRYREAVGAQSPD
jgi:hypothetical protein